jgi:hypothetical protein
LWYHVAVYARQLPKLLHLTLWAKFTKFILEGRFMKKSQQLFGVAIAMTLILAGCTNDTTAISQPEVQVSSAVTDAANSEDTQIAIAEPVQKDTSETPTPNEDSAEAMTDEMQALLDAVGETESNTKGDLAASDTVSGYPSTDEILAALTDEEGKLYWLAVDPVCPETCDILEASSLATETVWDMIYDGVFQNASMTEDTNAEYHQITFDQNGQSWTVKISTASITLSADSDISSAQVSAIVDTLSECTNMDAIEAEGASEDVGQFVFTHGGIAVDEYGYSPESDVWVSETKVSTQADGSILISNPIAMQSIGETIATESFVSMDEVRNICEACNLRIFFNFARLNK